MNRFPFMNQQQMAQRLLNSGRFSNDPMRTNALQAIINNDEEAMENIVRNFSKESNFPLEKFLSQFNQQNHR